MLLVFGGGACSSMNEIDRRIERTVLKGSTDLGGGAVAPVLRSRVGAEGESSGARASRYEKNPPSTNPSADELEFTGADPARDVVSRLDSYSESVPGAMSLDLSGVLRISQGSAREYLTAEEDYLLTAIRLLIERHRWGPRFFDDVSANLTADPIDGRYQTALNVMNELRATQRLPYGGEVEARLITRAANQLTEIVGDQYLQSSQLVLGANVPLLRNAGLTAQEELIQAERDLVYSARDFETFRRRFFVDVASDYFSLLAQQAVIRNQQDRLASVIKFLEQTRALVEAGRERPFQARNVEQNVLSSRNDLINSRESYILNLDRFKIRLGIPVEKPVELLPMTLELDDPEVSVTESSEMALRYRLDLQNQRDRVDDSRRQVEVARNRLLPDLNLAASATLNTGTDNELQGLPFRGDLTSYAGSVTFGLPLDREIERLELRRSLIELERQQREYEQFRDGVVLESRQSVREIDRARFSVRLQEQAVRINELRLEEIMIKRAEVDTQTRLDAENELLRSRNDLDAAIRDLRISILEYLASTGQLRVGTQGEFRPLRGMVLRIEGAGRDEAASEAEARRAMEPDQADPADQSGDEE